MAIPIKQTDKLVINLDGADDRMEVHVNGHLVDALNVGDPAKTHNLISDFTPGTNTVRVIGIDTQIPHRSVAYRVVKVSNGVETIVWQDRQEQTNGPGDASPKGQWYDNSNQFVLS